MNGEIRSNVTVCCLNLKARSTLVRSAEKLARWPRLPGYFYDCAVTVKAAWLALSRNLFWKNEERFLRLSLPEQLAVLLSLINCRDRSLMPVQPELHRVHEDQPLKAHSSWQAIEHGLDDRTSKVYRDCISQFVSLTAKWLSLETLYSKIGPNKCCLSSTFSYTNIIRIIAYDCPLLASFPTESSLINQLAGWPRT